MPPITVIHPSDGDALVETFDLVCCHFDNVDKGIEWMQTLNSLLGGISPFDMFRAGRVKKLLKTVKLWISENEAPDAK